MADAHSEMLELAVALATREAAGATLSAAERAVADIMWIGTQVSPNGFDGWLYYTNCERMRSTLNALEEVGFTEVAALARKALEIAAIDPGLMSDEERESAVDRMTEEGRGKLDAVDSRFYDVYEHSMELLQSFARVKGVA
jgi:uncharacterized protein DUF4375